MTDDTLLKAIKLKENINELHYFIKALERSGYKVAFRLKDKFLNLFRIDAAMNIELRNLTKPQQMELYALLVRWKEEAEREFNELESE